MPLVIPKSGPAKYVASKLALGELLGHSNFDGEDWAIGDRLIFVDGTESRIKQPPGELYYDWDDPVPADFGEVSRAVGVTHASGWPELFQIVEVNEREAELHLAKQGLPGCLGRTALFGVVLLGGLGIATRMSPWLATVVAGVTVLIMWFCIYDIRYRRAQVREAKERKVAEIE